MDKRGAEKGLLRLSFSLNGKPIRKIGKVV